MKKSELTSRKETPEAELKRLREEIKSLKSELKKSGKQHEQTKGKLKKAKDDLKQTKAELKKKVHPIFGVMQTGFYPSNVKTKTFKTPYIFSEPYGLL